MDKQYSKSPTPPVAGRSRQMTIDQLIYDEIVYQDPNCIIVRRNGVTEQYIVVGDQFISDDFMNQAYATLGI